VLEISVSDELENEPQDAVTYTIASLFAQIYFDEFWQEEELALVSDTKEFTREAALTEWGFVKPETVAHV
jgi:hypothetical protein